MFGNNDRKKEPQTQANPRVRSSIYGMAALYLLYLYYKTAAPFLKGDPNGPSVLQFVLGTVVLLGGGILLGVLAWKMYKLGKELEEEAMREAEEEALNDEDPDDEEIEDEDEYPDEDDEDPDDEDPD